MPNAECKVLNAQSPAFSHQPSTWVEQSHALHAWFAREYCTAVPIETVFLDAGGVLVFPNWTRVSAALAQRDVLVTSDALAIAEFRAKRRLDLGETISATDDSQRGWLYFNLTLEEAGIARTAATDAALAELRAYHGQENLWESVPADVVPTLVDLRAKGKRLVVVSNAQTAGCGTCSTALV